MKNKSFGRDYPLSATPDPNQKKPSQKKLPSGASSASAEKDYAESERLRKSISNLSGSQTFDIMAKKGKNYLSDVRAKADSLKKEGDRKTKATGGVRKDYRF